MDINALTFLQEATMLTEFSLDLQLSNVEDISAFRFQENAVSLTSCTIYFIDPYEDITTMDEFCRKA